MNTEQRISLLGKFSQNISTKLSKVQKQKKQLRKQIQNHQIEMQNLPKVQIISQLTNYHQSIDNKINQTYESLQKVMKNLNCLKNKKQNTTRLIDILTSINQIKDFSYQIKIQNCIQPNQTYRMLAIYYQIKGKVKHCQKYVKQIETQIEKIQIKYKKDFDAQLTKTNSNSIKELSKVLELIKSSKKTKDVNEIQNLKGINSNDPVISSSLSQICSFYISLCKTTLHPVQQQLFTIPIIGPSTSQSCYIFFQLIKSSLKQIVSLLTTYKSNILQLQSNSGLHKVILQVFRFVMDGLGFQILIRQRKYYQVGAIAIKRDKLTIKQQQYKLLKSYFQEFNAIWNQVERFRIHLQDYIDDQYKHKLQFVKELAQVITTQKFVEFNYQIILYFQAFFRHQLDRLIKKNTFILSLWQVDEQFFKQVRQKNQYKSNLAGQDFLQQMITKFADGVKKSFQTLNILIVSAIINFINHNLIYEDSFYAFNELITRFISKIQDPRSIQGMVILLNTVSSYPKAIKSSFEQMKIPQQLPTQRIHNQISQLMICCQQKTCQFISQSISIIISNNMIQSLLEQKGAQKISKLFMNLQKQLYQQFMNKLSKSHVQLILTQQFVNNYTHMQVINLEKDIRAIIHFYQQHSHSIRINFRQILDYIQILLVQNQREFNNFLKQLRGKYQESQLIRVWKLRK